MQPSNLPLSEQSEWDQASSFSKYTFSIANTILTKGLIKPLQPDDMLHLPAQYKATFIFNELADKYKQSNKGYIVPKLMNALNASNRSAVAYNAIYATIESGVKLATAVVLFLLLESLLDSSSPYWLAYVYALTLGILSLLQTLIHGLTYLNAYALCANWKISCIAMIFSKLFNVKTEFLADSTGKLVNLISNDVSRFEVWGLFAVFIWEALLEVIGIFLILVFYLGIYPALAGVGTCFLIMPVQMLVANKFDSLRTQTAQETDNRVRHTSEVIEGITSVKSFGWEKPFSNLIGSYRAKEMLFVGRSQVLRAFFQGVYYSGCTVATFATFAVFWAEGKIITIPLVFSTLMLLQTLRVTVYSFWAKAIETGNEAISASNRIDNFLSLDEKTQSSSGSTSSESAVVDSSGNSRPLVEIRATSYTYGDSSEDAVLSDIDVEVRPGELVMVVGKVGAGKSSLLNAILGEMTVCTAVESAESSRGRIISPATRIAFCPQRPWILAASVRENIVFAGEAADDGVDEELYRLAVESCRIVQDMNQWPAYDNSEIGERGVSVSGGQKARIALARAVYSNADLCVLDDPLSAVDATVSKALFFNCIVNALKKRGKGVVLATHQLQYLPYADRILLLDDEGRQVFSGSHEDLQAYTGSIVSSLSCMRSDVEENSFEPILRVSDSDTWEQLEDEVAFDPSRRINIGDETHEEESRRHIIEKEDRIEGMLALKIYWKYMKAGGVIQGMIALTMAAVSQIILMISDYWIRWWASSTFGPQSEQRYVWIFSILTFVSIVFGFVRALMWFQYCLNASANLHSECFKSVVRTSLAFFTANPTGRILNRFSRDMNIVDEQLPAVLFDCIQNILQCVSAFILVFITIPYMILFIPPLLILIFILRRKYIASLMELKRIEAVSRSPIYANFSAVLDGLLSLRAYKLEGKMKQIFFSLLDDSSSSMFNLMVINRWYGLRLDCLCAFIILILSILSCYLRDTVDVGLLGFALTYMLGLSDLFQWTIRQSAEVESMMTSVERLNTYIDLPSERYADNDDGTSKMRPSNIDGEKDIIIQESTIKFGSIYKYKTLALRGLTVKYRLDLDPVLKDLTLVLPFGSKVGICGRTGSGKSSLLLALLQLNIITAGDILLDDFSLIKMPLEEARSKISLIPQEPHLFSGTVRFNLDPFSIHTDEEIWSALNDASIKDTISRDSLGLMSPVEEGGNNFSQGQKQLISLARAILRKCPVILMDEVSASIDYETDELVQNTIRSSPSLKYSTIFTIAHRLRTIADSDFIMVIGSGMLIEFGRPYDLLLKSENCHFKSLAQESQEYDDVLYKAKANAECIL